MTTWHRTDAHGTRVTFTYTPDDRGNVTLTREEVEGLMRTGGWTPGPPEPPTPFDPHPTTSYPIAA